MGPLMAHNGSHEGKILMAIDLYSTYVETN